jgi:hypothetical protein
LPPLFFFICARSSPWVPAHHGFFLSRRLSSTARSSFLLLCALGPARSRCARPVEWLPRVSPLFPLDSLLPQTPMALGFYSSTRLSPSAPFRFLLGALVPAHPRRGALCRAEFLPSMAAREVPLAVPSLCLPARAGLLLIFQSGHGVLWIHGRQPLGASIPWLSPLRVPPPPLCLPRLDSAPVSWSSSSPRVPMSPMAGAWPSSRRRCTPAGRSSPSSLRVLSPIGSSPQLGCSLLLWSSPLFFPQRPAPSCRSPCLLPGSVGAPLWSRLVLCFLYQVRPELSLLGPCPSVCSSSSADHRCSSGAVTLCSRHAQSSARGALSRSPMVELLHQTAPVLATNPARPDT